MKYNTKIFRYRNIEGLWGLSTDGEIRIYSNEHEPIHVHAKKGEFESKAKFLIENGIITEIKITAIKRVKPLSVQ